MTYSAPFVHTVQQGYEPIFHSDSVKASDRVEGLQDTIDGKDAFGQNVYKGNTCPKVHLTMYARKMSTQAYNDKMLVHFF